MHARILATLKRKIFGLFCLVLFTQSLVALAHTNHYSRTTTGISSRHSRLARTIKPRGQNGRHTKFSHLGPAGIRAGDSTIAKINGVYIGIIPDAGDTGGAPQPIRGLSSLITHKNFAMIGWYAQVSAHKVFDGSQLFEIMDDLKATNAAFSPAIMPSSWQGLGQNGNYQAIAIARVLRKFTDANIPVILRFAHEANWYQRTQEYPGTALDFKKGWAAVAAAVRKIAPDVLLHWCPNVAHMKQYHDYFPDNPDETVDIVGIDYYPTRTPLANDFVQHAKEFHDTFAINGRKFAMGEAGLHYKATYPERLAWLTQMANAKKQLPNLIYINWYNSQKEYDYKIAGNGLPNHLLTERLE